MRILLLSFFLLLSCSDSVTLEQLKKTHPSSFREIIDRKENLLHETRTNFNLHRRAWTTLQELPPELVQEILQAEDKRFFSHNGIDILAMGSALKDWPKRGASTITMQLSGLIEGRSKKRGIKEKLHQILQAMILERSLSKLEILEAWINLQSFKGELQGIRAASLAFFGKDPRGLDQTERSLLLGMIPSPNQSKDKLLARSCRYLKTNSCESLTRTYEKSFIESPHTQLLEHYAPHVAQRIRKTEGDKIQVTIDRDLQIFATQLLRSHLRGLRSQNVQDGAILILDRKSGEVRAYVGSSGDFSASPLVDHVQALRQAGSTLKPLLFASAFAHRLLTMTSPLKDEPFSVTREGLTYQPENYQKGFTYLDVPAKVALGSSLNIPAVRVIDYVSPERFYHLLSDLEFRELQDSDYYGHSMALGSVDVSLWDLTRAYRTLAENGSFSEPSFFKPVTEEKNISIFTPEVSFIVGNILSEKNNRYLTFGIQSTLSTDVWSAVKTGTSKDMRDNWSVGFTDSYVIGVWVGNSSGSPMWNVTGITGAAPIFSQLVSELHKHGGTTPVAPKSLIKIGEDYYLPGTEPKNKESLIQASSVAKITFPQNGSQFAFDPEIPIENQRVLFLSTRAGLGWKLNGKKLSPAEIEKGFPPIKQGRYKLELWDEDVKRDEVAFYVKTGKFNPSR